MVQGMGPKETVPFLILHSELFWLCMRFGIKFM